MCFEAGLVWGKELFFDATKVEADAAMDSLVPRWAVEAHLGGLFEGGTGGRRSTHHGRHRRPARRRGRRSAREERGQDTGVSESTPSGWTPNLASELKPA
jgi:hypothetical protein